MAKKTRKDAVIRLPDPLPEPIPATEPKKANRTGKPINVWLPLDLHAAVEKFREDQRVKPSMTDVVELAILEFLTREGYWKDES